MVKTGFQLSRFEAASQRVGGKGTIKTSLTQEHRSVRTICHSLTESINVVITALYFG